MGTVQLNPIQKSAIVFAAVCFGGVLILHAPWDGYAYYNHVFDALSENALMYWFASILHVWVAIAFVILVAALIVYLFRTSKTSQ